ncbi:hypothetical protein MKD49_08220 [Herbaspirillum sp. WGmk3]|uniref:hypothetical protein n=1 Tax=Herbaspirillum sp. WGmk3 TaxID=2919925 RepID=UPI0020919439|nr:hypothetical protein [Herbaspirillum sp. WGmk3]MCO4856465.1 hypothetical protein [Herbaspirillum sp. WGmk3]
MQAAFELTDGLANLKSILASFPVDALHWSEAQNRFQFIDRLLVECLGWQQPNMAVEEYDDLGGRADYLLGNGMPPKAVLEAKKESKHFDFPPVSGVAPVRKLRPLLAASKELSAAVNQVIPYCAVRGVSIAIVCNGPQLVLFQAYIPNLSPLDGECYVFDGFESYVNNFPLLWKLLSPEGVAENTAYRDLSLHRNPRMPQKASTSIAEPNKHRYRSEFQENLRSLSSLLLEEIEDNPKLKSSFYKECYVPLEANNRHLLLSKKLIESRYKRVGENNIAPSALDSIAVVEGPGKLKFTDPTAISAGSSRPVVVIGDVGVGKTSFFENLYENLEGTEKANTYFIHLDLGIKATLTVDIKAFVLSEIATVLKKKYGVDIESEDFANAIYHHDLLDFDKSVKGALKRIDPDGYEKERIGFLNEKVNRRDLHLQASLGHLAHGRNKQIILILDNADQRSFAVQQEAFLIAQELAATRNLIVFVSLRPSTFYVSKTTGALSAYQNKILTISPPPADEVIQKRLIFAVRVAEGKVEPAALSGIRIRLSNVVSFLNATLRSVRTSEPIRQFLSNITGGNTRAVIELITGFFGSPNVDSPKIVRIEEEKGDYKIPLHEFTKHALLGEYAYFNAHSSLVACNLFDISSADPREHFLASLVVAYLHSNAPLLDNDGFVAGQALISEMLRHGFFEDQIRHAIRKLATKRLIETPHAHYRELSVDDHELPDQFHYRATSVGIYHIRYWSASFAFLDAVSTDTPIFDDDARAEVVKYAASFDIEKRYRKAERFRQYLETQWHAFSFNENYYNFVELLAAQDHTFTAVKTVIDRGALQHRK